MASIARCVRAAGPSILRSGFLPRPAPVRLCLPRIPHSLPRTFSSSALQLERWYTKDHEWIELSADRKTGVIGISEYAAEQLGDVVFVQLPELSSTWVGQGDAIGVVESVKSAADINAPLRCRITHANQLLEEKPAVVGQVPEDDSHGGGWIAKVALDEESLAGLESLMNPEKYKELIEPPADP